VANTIGGVISPTDTLMIIVPDGDNRLEVEVQINPQDVDQVRIGLPTRVRFSAFSRNSTPEIKGTLIRVGADRVREQQTGRPYYSGAVSFTAADLALLGREHQLMAGMPAEVYIRTGERTFASYLFKPLLDTFERGLKER
jgi:HlyD family secretion protein